MKILVMTGFDNNGGYEDVGLLSAPNKAKYAFKHGYDFICKRNYEGYDRPISWFKIKHIIDLLPSYDYIFWTDADCVITNYNIRIEDLINNSIDRPNKVFISPHIHSVEVNLPKLEETNYIIAHDYYSPCMGNFIIKNCKWSIDFFTSIYNQTQFMNDPIWDNRGQDYLFYHHPELMKDVKFVPKYLINSMIYDWKHGDFLIHFPAINSKRRVELINEYLQKSILT